MGACHLDLSRAEIDGPDVVITALGIMGSIDIVAPEGIDVDLTGLSIMGRKSLRMRMSRCCAGRPGSWSGHFPSWVR